MTRDNEKGVNLCRADACEQQAKDANLRAERVRAQLLSLYVLFINHFLPFTPCMQAKLQVFGQHAINSIFLKVEFWTIRKIFKNLYHSLKLFRPLKQGIVKVQED